MGNLHLTMACWNYDRTRALQEGRIKPDGIDLTYLPLPVEETFFRMLRHREFDAAEMSLSSYVVSLFSDNPPFITPEYQMTAGVWIRGILSDEYGVPVDSVEYFTGGEEEPGRPEKLRLDLPSSIHVHPIGPEKTLSAMLDSGEIDALYTARMPSCFARGSQNVRRLFPNYKEVEQAYFQKTRIFPIMHTVVIRRDVYEKHPWVAQSLMKALAQAQQEAYADLYQTAALKLMLPWLTSHVEETRAVMGRDFWPYGFEANEATSAVFLRYSYGQGLSKRLLQPRDLFAPETLESFKI
ncbi:MAG: ABC transporter substrate-binding protein [Limnochordaceae bacterium]|nr:ABC transporter substrate-binding protein [Limnochordaceae bacterium]